ncbi:MAG: ribonuclease R [Clostridia bacterium]|nr:ribonuclease R [Clostridia bacterium]
MKENNLLEGKYRKNAKGFGFVKVEEREEEIFISKDNSKNALNGDMVIVKLLDQNEGKREEGKVIKIIKHENDTIVGTFQKSKNFGFVVPDDKALGTDIFISKNNFGKARNNHKVVVKITKYPEKGKNAEGKVIEVIGNVNEAGVDMLSLIKEYSLPSKFPKEVIKEARDKGTQINPKDIKNRVDLRQKEIFTIDGEDAKDLDDAVRVEKLDNGNYILDVHIADVSYYVKQDSLLDKEAYQRGTSIYMLDRVIPMLPRELSNGICSLNAGEDRFTLSCSMEIDQKGKVVDSKIYKGIIKVTERMSYTDVQKILDRNDDKVLKRYQKYIGQFDLMAELANILKQRRIEQGYLNLDIPESKIELDIDGWAINVKKYETYFANEIIEQFMLTANETVAEKFYWLEAPFVYRVHEEPDIDKIKELNKFLFNFNMKIKASNDNVHPKAFAQVLNEVKGKDEERVVSNLVLRTLKLARYESENKGHFGIASKYYCHFTSPIRRYPDLFIHRVISEYLENSYNVTADFIEKYNTLSKDAANNSSEREKVATKVEREAEKIKKAEYMEGKIGEIYKGIVSSVTSFGMFVELENTVEGFIGFDDLGSDEYFAYDENRRILIGEQTKKIYKIGDKVNIRVKSASKILRQVDFEVYEDKEEILDNK